MLPFRTQGLHPKQEIWNLFIQMNHSELLGKADLARTAAFFHLYVPFAIVTVLQSFLCSKITLSISPSTSSVEDCFSAFLARDTMLPRDWQFLERSSTALSAGTPMHT